MKDREEYINIIEQDNKEIIGVLDENKTTI